MHCYVQVSLDDIAALDDVDQCIIYYNHAVILYYLKQYKAAFAILDKVMQFIEPMGTNTCSCVIVFVNTLNTTVILKYPSSTSAVCQQCLMSDDCSLSVQPFKHVVCLWGIEPMICQESEEV